VQDLLKMMSDKSKAFRYSSGGVGTAQHLQGALFAKLAGVDADHVPYRGQSEQLIGLVAGEVDYTFSSLPGAIGFVKDGRLRAIGVTTPAPSPSLPEVPSLSSAGLKGFEQSTAWFGIVVPGGTADPVVETLHRAFAKTLANPAVQAKLAKIGFDAAPPDRPGEFGQFIREQIPFWAELVRISGASAQ
jgi:tripartite-type tricarboxylate transporter receptor subunit TctC